MADVIALAATLAVGHWAVRSALRRWENAAADAARHLAAARRAGDSAALAGRGGWPPGVAVTAALRLAADEGISIRDAARRLHTTIVADAVMRALTTHPFDNPNRSKTP